MSARRRQETIARFSVPVKSDDVVSAVPFSQAIQPAVSEVAGASQRSARRRTRASQSILLDEAGDNEKDDDFVINDTDVDDDDFIDDDDENVPPARTRGKKGKAVTKGKGKAKAKKVVRADDIAPEPISLADDVNPRVMLISLKAGALGLNLTVANNVYL